MDRAWRKIPNCRLRDQHKGTIQINAVGEKQTLCRWNSGVSMHQYCASVRGVVNKVVVINFRLWWA